MTARTIVSNPEILGGRWHFEGTTIPIAAVRTDYAQGGADVTRSYYFMDLTNDEIQNALAFDFPAIRESTMETQYASVLMHCECGENTPKATTWPTETQVDCACGRTWVVEMTFRLLAKHTTMNAD